MINDNELNLFENFQVEEEDDSKCTKKNLTELKKKRKREISKINPM